MPKFVFQLEGALRQRKQLERMKQREMAVVQAEINRLQEQLRALDGTVQTATADVRSNRLTGVLDMAKAGAAVKQQATFIMVQAVVFGLLMGNAGIDNYAHLGGFAGGYFTSAFLNPMTRERGDHMIIAMACLVATLLSIVVSVLTGLSLFK